MKEISIEAAYSEELLEVLNSHMDDLGQIKIEGCEDALIEVMPIDKKNFINEVEPVITFIIGFGSELALSVLSQWICEKIKTRKSIVVADSKVIIETKEDLIKLLTEV